jgi:hypothetical protein
MFLYLQRRACHILRHCKLSTKNEHAGHRNPIIAMFAPVSFASSSAAQSPSLYRFKDPTRRPIAERQLQPNLYHTRVLIQLVSPSFATLQIISTWNPRRNFDPIQSALHLLLLSIYPSPSRGQGPNTCPTYKHTVYSFDPEEPERLLRPNLCHASSPRH